MIKLFTHTDLDGYGCSLVAHYYLGAQNLDVAHCGYGKENNSSDFKISKFIENKEYENFDFIFITDLSPSKDVGDLIQQTMGDKTIMLDHHDSAVFLMTEEKFPWARVYPRSNEIVDGENHLTCATWMLLEFFESPEGCDIVRKTRLGWSPPHSYFLDFIVEKIRRYDTWEWKNIYNDEKAGDLNVIFHLYGGQIFVKEFLERTTSDIYSVSDNGMFSENEQFFIKWDREKTNRLISFISDKKLYKLEFFGYDAAIAFSDTHTSELGNKICEDHPDIDMAIIISLNTKTISIRSNKPNMHLGEFVKQFGGGGHALAAGCQFDDTVVQHLIREIMTDMLWTKYEKSKKISVADSDNQLIHNKGAFS